MAKKQRSIISRFFRFILKLTILLALLAASLIAILLYQTPHRLCIDKHEINGTSLKELGLSNTKIINIIKQVRKLDKASEKKIVENGYNSTKEKSNSEDIFKKSNLTNYSDIYDDDILFDKNYYIEFDDTTLAYVLNEVITQKSKAVSDLSFISELNGSLVEVDIEGKDSFKTIIKVDISNYTDEIKSKLGILSKFIKVPNEAYLVCDYTPNVDNNGQLNTTTKSITVNGVDNAVNNAILEMIVDNCVDKSKDKTYISDTIGQLLSNTLINIGKIGTAKYNSTTKEVINNVSYGNDGISSHKLSLISYQPDDFHAHNWLAFEKDVSPTLTTEGRLKRVCSLNASHVQYFTLPMLNNSDYTVNTVIETDCEIDGKYLYSITVNGVTFSYENIVQATGHTWSDVYKYDDSNHWHETTCKHKLTKDTEKHTLTIRGYDSEHGKIVYECKTCGYIQKKDCNHEYTKEIVSQATLDTNGTIKYTCVTCGYSYTDSYSHNLVETVVAATESDFGYTDYECSLSCEYHGRSDITYNLTNLYGYNYFKNTNSLYASLYEKIDTAYKSVGTRDIEGTTITVNYEKETIYQISRVDYTGMTCDDAKMVWSMYKLENPWYYWTENTMLYVDSPTSKQLIITIDADYAKYVNRKMVDSMVKNYIMEATSTIKETEQSKLVKAIHDYICNNMQYAYKTGTKVAEDSDWAHSIEGAIRYKKGVCESYAKMFYMLCSIYNIDTIMVIGKGKTEGHAWNYVKIDGKWYAIDTTWDDQSSGIISDYYLKGSANFTQHTAGTTNPSDEYYQYGLPELSVEDYN